MQSARYAQPRPPQVTISSTSMKNRSHCIVARVLIIGLSQKCAKSCRLHLTSCNDTVAQQLSHSCRAHPERLRAVWRVLDIHTHAYTPKYASAGADSTGISRHKQQHASFCKLRQCNTGRQCTAGDGGLMYCCGWSRRGEARRLQWHQLRHHTYQRAVEDRRGRDANAAEEVQCACSCCMAPDYQRLTLSHTMPPSLPPCNPPLPYNHLV